MTNIDFTKLRRIHFVGIKGIAMASLAVLCKEAGKYVTGTDSEDVFPSDEVLKKAKIKITTFDKSSLVCGIEKPDLVIYTGAHNGRDNPEVIFAQKKMIPTLSHGKALGLAMKGKRQISVAGSHGKTTTTAMIAVICQEAGLDISRAIGCGLVKGLGLPAHFGKSEFFIAEADEYVTDPGHDNKPRFFWQNPEIFVVTNVDYDHPDVYKSLKAVQSVFKEMMLKNVKKETIINYDDRASRILISATKNILTYGFNTKATLVISQPKFSFGKTIFRLSMQGHDLGEFRLQVPGLHNAANAAAAAYACSLIGISWSDIRQGLAKFGGAKRRFEKIGTSHGIVVYDDYAHHPKEIQATLLGARVWFLQRRIVTIFQPHTYSRTKSHLDEFAQAFISSDIVIISDIYPSARESDIGEINSQMLVNKIKKYQSKVYYSSNLKSVIESINNLVKPKDIIICMGAGNIANWSKIIFKNIKHNSYEN